MSDITAEVSKTIDATPSAVWTALTRPADLKTFFFGADVTSDFKVGSPIVMKGEMKGKSYEDKGRILEATPGRKLSFSHWSSMSGTEDKPENYHVVSFTLAPEGKGTKVTLTQANLQGGVTDADRRHRADYEKTWTMLLDGLAKTVGH